MTRHACAGLFVTQFVDTRLCVCGFVCQCVCECLFLCISVCECVGLSSCKSLFYRLKLTLLSDHFFFVIYCFRLCRNGKKT